MYQPAEQIATSEMMVGMAMSQVTAVDELFGTYSLGGDRQSRGRHLPAGSASLLPCRWLPAANDPPG